MVTTYHRTRTIYRAFPCNILFLCLLLLTNTIEGTTVLGVSLEEMLNNCEFVYEGRVINIESRMTPSGSNIHTYIVFDIIDVIKGEYHNDRIELSFAGGTVNGMTLSVGDMHMPEANEQGIYFVESLSRTQVHPLYGWSQGHLLIIKDAAGVKRITTQQKQPVMMVEPVTSLNNGFCASSTGFTPFQYATGFLPWARSLRHASALILASLRDILG